MWPYWILFLIPVYFALTNLKPISDITINSKKRKFNNLWGITYVFLVLIIGLRHEVGGDWAQYIELLNSYTDANTADQFLFQDPAFILLNKLAINLGGSVYLINVISALFFSWGLIVFCRAQPLPWLALVIAIPYLVTVVAMGYTRQGVAIGIAMIAMVALSKGETLRFFVWIIFASLFHKSAIVLIPMAVLSGTKRPLITFIWVFITSIVLYILLLQEALNFLINGYIVSEYQSKGAAIRIAMNALPAALFLIFYKKFKLLNSQKNYWKWMSITALILIGVLWISPSSTAVDRIALYWIPIQIFVFSRIPVSMSKNNNTRNILIYCVVAYSTLVHIIWLIFADTSFAWLPYQFYPLFLLWN
jgi:hypothetical protein